MNTKDKLNYYISRFYEFKLPNSNLNKIKEALLEKQSNDKDFIFIPITSLIKTSGQSFRINLDYISNNRPLSVLNYGLNTKLYDQIQNDPNLQDYLGIEDKMHKILVESIFNELKNLGYKIEVNDNSKRDTYIKIYYK